MKKFILILFFSFSFTSSGQNYIDYLNQANEAELQFVGGKDLKIAKEKLISLEKKFGRLLFKDYFYLGFLYYLENDSISGFKYLSKYADLSGNITYYLKECESKFPKLISKKTFEDLESIQNKNHYRLKDSIYLTKYKPAIDSISKYETLDQGNRAENINTDTILDLKIQKAYLSYLKKNGLPPTEVIGDTYLTILFHISNNEMKQKYLDFFYDQITKGNASPFSYAVLTDRTLYPETVYGSHAAKFSAKISKEQVIENRKKIGMSPYFGGPNIYPRLP